MWIMTIGTCHPSGPAGVMKLRTAPCLGMTDITHLRRRLNQQARVVSTMGRMAFKTGADGSRAMEEVAGRKSFMAVGAEDIGRDDKA